MIPLRFFRDKTHVYINNPDGTTKKMTIADFEDMLDGSGGGAGGASLVVQELYDDVGGYSYLDKTFSEIQDASKDGAVLVLSSYEEDGTTLMVNTAYVTYAGVAPEGASNSVITLTSFENEISRSASIAVTIYYEDDGVLKFSKNAYLPLPAYTFTVGVGDINVSPSTLFPYITGGNNCYFSDLGAGTNNTKNYTLVEYGNTGTTYYIELSNGNKYSGLWNADKMTLVTP